MASSVDVAVIKKLRSIYIDGKTLSVRSLRTDGKFLYVLLEGIEDRNSAEELRNKTVYADAEEIKLPDDTFFIDDVIGCKVIDTDGNVLGEAAMASAVPEDFVVALVSRTLSEMKFF